MPRHHVIISGTGRAGTTFLVQLFTALGLDTGFSSPGDGIFPECDAGMEKDLSDPNAPYIVKSPHLCLTLEALLSQKIVVIDHAIIPVRKLEHAAESRRRVSRRNNPSNPTSVNGGLWGTDNPALQEDVLSRRFHDLVHALVSHEVPTTFVHFPRIVTDADYLYRMLRSGVLSCVAWTDFRAAFERVTRPDLVHVGG